MTGFGLVKLYLPTIGALALAQVVSAAELRVTTFESPWRDRSASVGESDGREAATVKLSADKTDQTVIGFGTCMSELSHEALWLLPEADRAKVLDELFSPECGAFTVIRTPIGASDFSKEFYSYCETPDDFEMATFSTDHDDATLIPLIREVQRRVPSDVLKIWGSPWCPPRWMKTNRNAVCKPDKVNDLTEDGRIFEGEDGFVCDDAHMKAYALYFRKYVDSYRAKGVPLWMVMPQNEFNSDQNFPSCTWSVGQLAKFVGRYLGPALEGSGVELYFGTMERPNPNMLNAVLERPAYAKYVKGAGFQWAGKDALPRVRARHPDLTYVMSEQECGDGRNDWRHALHCWDLMLHYFSHGVSVYDYWNLALQKDGLSHWGWRQNSLVVVDAATRTAVFTPEYHMLKHLSHFVRRGAKRLVTEGSHADVLAFVNPDRSVVVMLANKEAKSRAVSVAWDGKRYGVTLEASSVATLRLPFEKEERMSATSLRAAETGRRRLLDLGIDACEITRAETLSNGVTEVEYVLRPSTSSFIRCTLALPAPGKWNGWFWGFGNGGSAGRVQMKTEEALSGSAAAHTDMGTSNGVMTDEVIRDFGHRATHLMTVSAKAMTEAFFGRKIERSCFYGQSTGGGQGFHEAMRYPEDYDGIVAGVPANTRLPLHIYFAYSNRLMRDADGKDVFTREEMDAVKEAAIECLSVRGPAFARGKFLFDSRWTREGEDAVLIRAVERCPSLAKGDKSERLRRLFRGPEIGGRKIHCGMPFGSDMRMAYGNQWMLEWWFRRNGIAKPLHQVTDGELLAWEKAWSPEFNACSENLDRFFARGGRLLVFGGLEDSCVPYQPMIDWYERAAKRYGPKLSECCRFYLIPGRSHGSGRYVTGIHDERGLLLRWVERGIAPETVTVNVRNGLEPFAIRPYPEFLSAVKDETAFVASEVRYVDEFDLSGSTCGLGLRTLPRQSVGGHPLTVGGKIYERGFGSHSEGAVGFRADGKVESFDALVGVDDDAAAAKRSDRKAQVVFKVWADGRIAWTSPVVRDGMQPVAVHVDLKGAKEIVLETSSSAPWLAFEACNGDWLDARFTCADGAKVESIVDPDATVQLGILTPPEKPEPRINGADIWGVRPGHPVIFRVATSGVRPMKFTAKGLPKGVTLDAAKGILGGVAPQETGDYDIEVTAENAKGKAVRTIRLVVGDTIALTPPMGWSSWNIFGDDLTEKHVFAAARAMDESGLGNHGWAYVNMDESWQMNNSSQNKTRPELRGPARDADGNILPNPSFPDMKGLTDYIHSFGFRAGIYSSPGPTTCGGHEGSYGHELQDARRWAEWGFDYVKYDWCSYNEIVKDELGGKEWWGDMKWATTRGESKERPYRLMKDCLLKQDRDIVYSFCQYGMGRAEEWVRDAGANCWRCWDDLKDTWPWMEKALESRIGAENYWKFAGPGCWVDPDMMIVGDQSSFGSTHPTCLSPNEQYTHVSLWCMIGSPLLLGCDLTKLDAFTKNLLVNDEVIAVSQDRLGKIARRIRHTDAESVWVRPLVGNDIAVALVNRYPLTREIKVSFAELGIAGERRVKDLWRQKCEGRHAGQYFALVPPHATKLVMLRPVDCPKCD